MIIKPNTTNVFKNTLQLTCFYKSEVVTPQWSVEGDATINANGLLTFNSEGEVIITATYNGVSESKTYYYEIVEIVNDVTLESNGNTSASSTMSTVGFVPTKGATTIKWGVTGGTQGLMCEYKDDGTCADYWGATENPRTVTINANSTLVKASFSTEHLANAYIMNAITGEYLWKGENVE
jgi:hypothetical protein